MNKWDRSSSLEMVTMSFPGLVGRWASIRIPLFSMEHDWVMKAHTFDDVLTIITWSLQQCCVGKMPECRHDGAPWCAADAKRKRLGGTDLGCAALLCQVTGDWKMFKDVFRFPQHNEVAGCCFKCSVTPAGIRDTTSAAPWRNERLGHWDLIARMRSQGITPTPLFNAPAVRSSIFRLDWLHVADLGVSADWLGCLFTFLAEHKFPGRSFAAKLSGLWQRIQQLHRVHPPAARLDQLTDKMLNRGSPSPKLRCYGMEVRCLIPVAKDLAQEYLREGDLVEQAIRQGTPELSACYDCLSRSARWRISHALPQVCHVACLPRSASPWCLPREAQTALLPRCASKTCQVARHLIGHTARKSSEVARLALACAEEGPTRLVQLGGKRSSSLWRGTGCPNLTDGIGTEATGIH